MTRHKFNFVFDTILAILFVLTVISAFSGQAETVHNIAGIVLLTGIAVHLVLHWRYVAATVRKPKNPSQRVRIVLGCTLFAVCGLSALVSVMMGDVLPDPFVFSLDTWRSLHRWSGRLMAIFTLVHIVLHAKWFISAFRRYHIHNKQPQATERTM
jgi:cytochrome c biogenesis factor